MSKKAVTEQMSLVPPVGGVGTAINPTQSSTLGVGTKKSQTAAITQNLVKQINAVSAAKKTNQQQLIKLIDQLKQSIAKDESNEEKIKKSKPRKLNNNKVMATKQIHEDGILGTIARTGLKAAGTIAGAAIPVAGELGIGEYAGYKAGEAAGNALLGKEQDEQTSKQGHAVHALLQNGFRITHTKHEDHGDVIVLTKKTDKHTTKTAEVEPDGTVSGHSVGKFLSFAQDEQIAKYPLMQKEAVTTINFLKAISQKNYAQADKYLGSLVNEKLKRIINKASK